MGNASASVVSRESLRRFLGFLDAVDQSITAWMNAHGLRILRYSLGVVFIWFGLLKPLGLSPIAEVVANVVYLVPPDVFIPILGWWEVAIGICLLYRPLIRLGILLLFIQMPGTFLPLILLPGVTWTVFPVAPTVEGQYIIKNLILIGAALVVGGSVRNEDEVPALLRSITDRIIDR